MDAEPLALHRECRHCKRPITIAYWPDEAGHVNVPCPYDDCDQKPMAIEVPGLYVGVWCGHGPDPGDTAGPEIPQDLD
jgi:hypothetical protein